MNRRALTIAGVSTLFGTCLLWAILAAAQGPRDSVAEIALSPEVERFVHEAEAAYRQELRSARDNPEGRTSEPGIARLHRTYSDSHIFLLRGQVQELRAEVAQLRREMDRLKGKNTR